MRIVFCGTPEFSVKPLEFLIQNKCNVVGVYTQPDRGVGRGRKINYSAVKQCAVKHDIAVFQPQNFKDPKAIQELQDLKPDLLIVVAYGLILPQKVLDIPALDCWNIHASLLPRWRGAAPIHRALLAGDKTTGVGIMQMQAGLDTGPVFVQHECAISKNETALQLHDKLALMGAFALLECLQLLQENKLPEPMEQEDSNKTYAHKLEKSESKVSWQESAQQLDRKIRAFNPWPGVLVEIKGEPYKIAQASVYSYTDNSQVAGEIVIANKNTLVIQCSAGQLQIEIIQKAGKKQMPINNFMPSKSQWFTA